MPRSDPVLVPGSHRPKVKKGNAVRLRAVQLLSKGGALQAADHCRASTHLARGLLETPENGKETLRNTMGEARRVEKPNTARACLILTPEGVYPARGPSSAPKGNDEQVRPSTPPSRSPAQPCTPHTETGRRSAGYEYVIAPCLHWHRCLAAALRFECRLWISTLPNLPLQSSDTRSGDDDDVPRHPGVNLFRFSVPLRAVVRGAVCP